MECRKILRIFFNRALFDLFDLDLDQYPVSELELPFAGIESKPRGRSISSGIVTYMVLDHSYLGVLNNKPSLTIEMSNGG